MSRDPAYLLDILQECRLVLTFVEGIDQNVFNTDLLRQHAVTRSIEIIGEAAKRLSDEFRDLHPEIPWKLIISMRNVLIHQYDDVKLDVVWDVLHNEIPTLITQIAPFISDDNVGDNNS
jgi:uncharacterized protein with HEPN domain